MQEAHQAFARSRLQLSKQQVVGWVLLVSGLLIQAGFLAFLIIISVNLQNKLSSCQDSQQVAQCPASSEVVPIWVTLAVSAVFGLAFVVAAGFAFSKQSRL